MSILIDECIDERFRNSLPGYDCQTARYAGLAVPMKELGAFSSPSTMVSS